MTIPITKCKSLTTGEIIIIPGKVGFTPETLLGLEAALDAPDGEHRFGNARIGVKTTEFYKYAGLLTESPVDGSGKIRRIEYSLADFDKFCSSIEIFAEENTKEFVSYAHDVRYTIGTLVHRSVVNARNENDTVQLASNLKIINDVTSILSAKDCFFRYQTGAYSGEQLRVDVTGKFFKIFKASGHLSTNKSKKIRFDFESDKDCFIQCYDIFDFIPYLIIENAIKYSPTDMDVSISIKKHGRSIVAEVDSFGPLLLDGEHPLIFERGVRGVNAKRMGIGGQGMGLYHVSKALHALGLGKVEVDQPRTGYCIDINGVEHLPTAFKIILDA